MGTYTDYSNVKFCPNCGKSLVMSQINLVPDQPRTAPNQREKSILGKLHPNDFGIPREHWEAAECYARELVIQTQLNIVQNNW